LNSKLSKKTIAVISASVGAAVLIAAAVALILMGSSKNSDEDIIDTEKATEAQTDSVTSTDAADTGEPEIIDPLTGLKATEDYTGRRPVAIMINNIKESLPQEGISYFDIMYECLAEGGITRMLGVVSDWENLPETGSVRSSRDYYIDFAQDFDAIYVHAGGSELAYSNIASRGINNLDGVRGTGTEYGAFFRDSERLATMSSEHTMMTVGEGIAAAIEGLGYRTDLRDGFDSPLDFVTWCETFAPDDKASHICVPFSGYQRVDYVYDVDSGNYLRYQHYGNKHIDNTTGEQLSFKNIFVLFCATYQVDDYGRLGVTTTGEGTGYYATEGAYMPIVWKKDSRDSSVSFYDTDGNALEVNRGKTMINVCSTGIEGSVSFDDEWSE
jgi:hypothetical protein